MAASKPTFRHKMVWATGFEPALLAGMQAFYHNSLNYTWINLAVPVGIEPTCSISETDALPLCYGTVLKIGSPTVNRTQTLAFKERYATITLWDN